MARTKKQSLKHMREQVVSRLPILALSTLLAGVSTWRYFEAVRPILAEWTRWHANMMTGEAGAPLGFRVISYLIPELIIQTTGVAPWVAYLAERFLFLFLVAAFGRYFFRRWLSPAETTLALVVFFLMYDLTIYPHFQPAEEINIFMFLLGFSAIADRRFGWLACVIAVGAFNKQTVVFLIPTYAAFEFLHTQRIDRTWTSRSLILCALFFGVSQGLRFAMGDRPYFTEFWQYEQNLARVATQHWRHLFFLLPSLVPMLLILLSWRAQPLLMRATALMIPFFVAAHFAISIVSESRTHMPLGVVTIPATWIFLHAAFDRFRPSAPPPRG
jgi:hypothetical protein